MIRFTPLGKVCSFCGMTGTNETKFAGGLGPLMCGECLERYHQVFSSGDFAETSRPPWSDLTNDELAHMLPAIVQTADQVSEFLNEWVALARRRHVSWQTIGDALGVSRQAAWERFSSAVQKIEDHRAP